LKSYLWYSLRRGIQICRGWQPDVLLCGSLVTLPTSWLLSSLFACPLAVIVYGSDLLKLTGRRWLVLRFFLRRAKRVIAISHFTHDLALRAGVRSDRLTIIPPGVDINAFARESELDDPDSSMKILLGKLSGCQVLLSIGRLVRRKGILEFIEQVMPDLVRQFPNLKLVVVGDDSLTSLIHPERMRERIERRISELKLITNVIMIGAVPREILSRLLRRADLFVMPVRNLPDDVEGFGIVLLEAALCELPCVATRVGGIPDAIEEGVTGMLLPPDDPKAMIGAVANLLQQPDRARAMGRAGSRRARESFNWNVIAGRYHAVLSSLIADALESAPTGDRS
jgi:phosphatidylinositol alpha-1,6-mannosyltransferase